jgi:hypothetical protein
MILSHPYQHAARGWGANGSLVHPVVSKIPLSSNEILKAIDKKISVHPRLLN